MAKGNAVLTTNAVKLPFALDLEDTQVITFGTGIDFTLADAKPLTNDSTSAVVLPCIFGSQLQGPILLATGTAPSNVPFADETTIRDYYEQLQSVVVIVDERMTDNARNLATSWRINALFIVQITVERAPKTTEDVLQLMNSTNINAVTALAGPQSLVLIQILDRYYFYRGIANQPVLDTSEIVFGSEITSVTESEGLHVLIDRRVKRIINLDESCPILLPTSGQVVRPQDLQKLFEGLEVDEIRDLKEDILAAVPQLQATLNQKDLAELSTTLVSALSAKVSDATAPLRNAYIRFLTQEHKDGDTESVKKKNQMLGELRKTTLTIQKALEPVISSLANLISSQTTSKRTHDLKRLVRQTQIQDNIEAVKSMTFETLAGYLETHAGEMGVMLLNIETAPYRQLLGNLTGAIIDAR